MHAARLYNIKQYRNGRGRAIYERAGEGGGGPCVWPNTSGRLLRFAPYERS